MRLEAPVTNAPRTRSTKKEQKPSTKTALLILLSLSPMSLPCGPLTPGPRPSRRLAGASVTPRAAGSQNGGDSNDVATVMSSVSVQSRGFDRF